MWPLKNVQWHTWPILAAFIVFSISIGQFWPRWSCSQGWSHSRDYQLGCFSVQVVATSTQSDVNNNEKTVRGWEALGLIFFFFHKFIYFYFWLRWVFVAVRRLSLVAASGGYSSLQCTGFSLRWLLLLQSMGSRHVGFSSCGMWAQQLWLTGSRAQA